MKYNKLLMLAPVVLLSLTSCGRNHRYENSEYILKYSDAANATDQSVYLNDDFFILQLSDIHLTYLADNDVHFRFIEKTIKAASKAIKSVPTQADRDIDLIVITGDTFTFASKDTIIETCNFFEKQGYPWTITFGNHDEQGYFSVDWMTNYLTALSNKQGSNLLFKDITDDDVYGSANFFIDVDPKRQLVILDSNRYNYGEGLGYDYIHSDQINWYERMINDSDRTAIASLAFFHIPFPEFVDGYNKAKQDNSKFLKSRIYNGEGKQIGDEVVRDQCGEEPSTPLINSGLYHKMIELDDTKGVFVGHDHINHYCCDYASDERYNSIVLCYGIKSTNTVYYDDAYLGGQLITFHGDKTETSEARDWFDTDLILHRYSEMEAK